MTAAAPIFDVELSPVARQVGVTYLHEVDLEDDVELTVGDDVCLRDEGGTVWDATVTAVEPARVGRKYRLTLRAPAADSAPTVG